MKAFHNNPAIKQKYLDRVRAHAAADEIIKGHHWQNGKGCAVGCTIHSGDHAAFETDLGIPQLLARLEDRLFEGMPNDAAKLWPEEFLSAINVGADLSKIWPKFALWLIVDPKHGVIKYNDSPAITAVADLFKRTINNEIVTIQEWQVARKNAAAVAVAVAVADAAVAVAVAVADAAAAVTTVAYVVAAAAIATVATVAYVAYVAATATATAATAVAACIAVATATAVAESVEASAVAAAAAVAVAVAYAEADDAARQQSYYQQSRKLLELLKESV